MNKINYIYLFISPNGKCYVGITNNLRRRFIAHRWEANTPTSNTYNTHFHKAIRKYGIENFEYSTIFTFTNLISRNTAEQYFIALYNGYTEGYNLTKGGEGSVGHRPRLGKKNSEESKRKVGVTLKGHSTSKETIEKIRVSNSIPVKAFNKDTGDFEAWYCSQREAARDLGICFQGISAAILGKQKSAAGFKWLTT